MKKNYLFSLIAVAFTFCAANAQFSDGFESYALGSYHGGNWSSWSGTAGAEDITVSSAFAYDGTKSGLIGGSGAQDAMLRLGNKTSGVYKLTFQAYIPVGKSGYMNFQGTTTASGGAGNAGAGIFNSPNLIFNNVMSVSGAAGTGGAYPNVDDAAATYTWTYPQGAWFPIVIDFDIDGGTWTMTINGTAIAPQPFDDENVLGGIDFYSFDSNNQMYIDAISYQDVLSVADENLQVFRAYPNPVTDYLYVSSNSVVDVIEVYDILGHTILTIRPSSLNPKVDMRQLASGSYFVKATVGNQSKTLKIIK